MEIKAIFGLGNPGERYENTYHNVGSILVKRLENRDKFPPRIFVMSENKSMPVFMNESGIAMRRIMKKINAKPKNVLVVHDDSDIALGKFKYAYGSRSAGHKGVESIINALGTNNFHRLKIGIRTKPGKALDFVLKKISKKDSAILSPVFRDIAAYLEKNIS